MGLGDILQHISTELIIVNKLMFYKNSIFYLCLTSEMCLLGIGGKLLQQN